MQLKYYLSGLLALVLPFMVQAGNPDRQGEAGAHQLLLNPWARSAGVHNMNVASVQGIEAVQLNVAGLSRLSTGSELSLGHMRYLVGTEINMNAIGYAQRLGKGRVLGISLQAMDFGDLITTSETTPEGTGGTFSPSFFTLGLSISKSFDNKVSVGVTGKFVNESTTNVAARGFALDAGVQYVAGADDRFKLGIALRNIGSRMAFRGEGLNQNLPAPIATTSFNHTYYQRSNDYEMPSQLILGISHDWKIGDGKNKISAVGSFVSNAFSRDNVGVGAEAYIGPNMIFRAGYKYEFGVTASDVQSSVDNGIAAGLSFGVASKKRESQRKFWIDYAYRSTIRWSGSHNISLRANL